LLRALTEAVQVRTTYISGTRDDLQPEEYGEAHRALRRRDAARLRRDANPARDFSSMRNHAGPSFADDLAWLLSRLQQANIQEVIVVDLAKPAFDIPVVRVVIPGLEGPDDHDSYIPGERSQRMAGDVA
jgi:ribosomal protein S12 methylthiotransferase accessory factor